MRYLLTLLLATTGVARAEDTVRASPPCDLWLELSAPNLRRIADVVRRDPPGDLDAVAFVPMTAGELRRLARDGVSRAQEGFSVYAHLENPKVSRWQKDPGILPSEETPTAREARLEHEAWVKSVIELVSVRARVKSYVPHMFAGALRSFLTELRPMHPRLRDEPFSPDFSRIARAVAEVSELAFDEPFTCDLEASGHLEELFNLGPNYARLVARQRLRALACILGIRWDDIDAPESRARRHLPDMFRDLPGHAGFRVALDDKVFGRIRWSTEDAPKLFDVDISFVTGIEAFGEAGRRSLDEAVSRTSR